MPFQTHFLPFLDIFMPGSDEKKWCGREDLNLHGLAPTSPSSWRVYRSTTAAGNQDTISYLVGTSVEVDEIVSIHSLR